MSKIKPITDLGRDVAQAIVKNHMDTKEALKFVQHMKPVLTKHEVTGLTLAIAMKEVVKNLDRGLWVRFTKDLQRR